MKNTMQMANCPTCEATIPAIADVCMNCGKFTKFNGKTTEFYADIKNDFTESKIPTIAMRHEKENGNSFIEIVGVIGKAGLYAGFLLILIAVVGTAAFFLAKQQMQDEKVRNDFQPVNTLNTSQPKVDPTIEQPISQPEVKPKKRATAIVKNNFHINANSYSFFQFTIDELYKVRGNFAVQGGRNDIEVFIMDEMEFINFKNKNDFKSYYRSGSVTVGQLDVNLKQGNYYLVFQNVAWFDNKTINADIWQQN